MDELGGEAITLDITAVDAPNASLRAVKDEHGGVDIVVHNAGITRDKKLANMAEDRWTSVIDVNLTAPERITAELARPGADPAERSRRRCLVDRRHRRQRRPDQLRDVEGGGDRLRRRARADAADQDVTVNAVAPGFIETQMTASIPLIVREAGRRMNSMSQGGLPVDVAETVAWFAAPRHVRRDRERRPGVRAEPARCLT